MDYAERGRWVAIRENTYVREAEKPWTRAHGEIYGASLGMSAIGGRSERRPYEEKADCLTLYSLASYSE
jgi:hypothetical protein